jgi:PEP-CTERM motif
MRKILIGTGVALFSMCGLAHADTIGVQYFSVAENAGADFDVCCSSPPATFPLITVGSALGPDGRPVQASGGTVVMTNSSHEILWWTPNGSSITADGTATVAAPFSDNSLFVPHGTGTNNNSFFQTAILTGTIHGTGVPITLQITGDDDVLVYLNGKYAGGEPGVHGAFTSNLALGTFSGDETIQVFYADRANSQAALDLTLVGATVTASVPEPSTWAMMILGFMGVGFMAYRRKAHSSFRIA